MTRKEIEKLPFNIDMLLSESLLVDTKEQVHKKITEVCSLAIKALEQEPCDNCDYKEWLKGEIEQEPCEDCISRKALLEEIENGIKAGNYEEGYEEYPHINDMNDIIECVKYAESVQPKPKTDVLDKIRAEIHATAEMHEDGDYYLRDEWIDEIIDKYKAESEEV